MRAKLVLTAVAGLGVLSLICGWPERSGDVARDLQRHVALPVAMAQQSTPPKKEAKEKLPLKGGEINKFMRAKLGAAQLVLEGLALEDYDKISEGTDTLSKLSSSEKWRVSEDPLYSQHTTEFLKIARKMKGEATKKNLDGVALNYVQLTLSCVECHRFVRTVLLADH